MRDQVSDGGCCGKSCHVSCSFGVVDSHQHSDLRDGVNLENNLWLIEDNCDALGSEYEGKKTGSFGDISTLSFYPAHHITTGEGGMITTDNAEWATRMRMMSLHGLSRDAWNRYSSQGSWYYEILSPGFKYNLTDIAAALGLAQLKKCERFWKGREQEVFNGRYQPSSLIEPLPGSADDR